MSWQLEILLYFTGKLCTLLSREQLKTFRDKSGQWEYDFAFDINLCDVTGQSPLYLACCVSNIKIVDLLLNLKVRRKYFTTNLPTSNCFF